jgi:hypothetical protein
MRTIVTELRCRVKRCHNVRIQLELQHTKKRLEGDHRGCQQSGHFYSLSGANCPYLSRECTQRS